MTIALIAITVCALAFAAYVFLSHEKIAQRKAEALLAKWKVKEEKSIREDAYQRSRAVSFGEVKSGNSNLNQHQKNIKDAILKGRVHWHEFTADGIWEHESRKQHLNKNKNK